MKLKGNFVAPVILTALGTVNLACSEASDPQSEHELATVEQALSPSTSAVAYQAKSGRLAESGPDYTGTTSGVMMPGTSPSIAEVNGGTYRDAFQGKDGFLWVNGPGGPVNQWYGLDKLSSPSIAGMAGSGYQVAFQANTHELWVIGAPAVGVQGPQGLPMAPGTNPAIAKLGSSWEVAFRHVDGNLWLTGNTGTFDTGYPMAPNTSPSIASLNASYNGFEVAYQGANGNLWVYGTESIRDMGYGMAPNTSPSIAATPPDSYGVERYQIAFQANTSHLFVAGPLAEGDVGFGMAPNTSPSIAALPGGGWEAAFQANTGHYWLAGSQVTGDTNVLMAAGTSPSITPVFRAPTGLKYTIQYFGSGIFLNLSWTGALGANVYFADQYDNVSATTRNVVTNTQTTFSNLSRNWQYHYRVTAHYWNGFEVTSSPLDVRTPK